LCFTCSSARSQRRIRYGRSPVTFTSAQSSFWRCRCSPELVCILPHQRTQTVSVNDQMSGPHAVSCSVPRGSVLGPLEFTAYTEDLDDVVHNNELNRPMYVDDTQLMRSTRINRRQSIIERLQACIADNRSWCRSRRLQLNPSKIESIWFGSRTNFFRFVTMHAFDRQKDGQTDRIPIAIPRLHSMQRGKNKCYMF